MSKRLRLPVLLLLSLTLSNLLQAATIYVNPAAVGANNGTSWANAYTSLSTALTASVNGDEIWVVQGVYKPVTQVDVNANGALEAREVTFQIKSGVAVYGGFVGTEVAREERNWVANPTILSGDIDNNDINGDGNSIAETISDRVGNNAYHVVYTNNVSTATRLDGFTVTAGYAYIAGPLTEPNLDGAGWYNNLTGVTNASSPTLQNLVFRGNYAESEGGAMFSPSAPTGGAVLSLVKDCRFINNITNQSGGAIALGSFSLGNYAMHIVECEFTGNEALRRGGALYFIGDHAIVDSCTFDDNKTTAISDGTTLPGSGGAAAMTASNAIFNYCIFQDNSATGNPTGAFEGGGGGAVYMSANESQTTILGISNPTFISCGFFDNLASGNTASWGGAATHLSDAGKLRPKYVNCVFSGNESQNNGGAVANFARVISAAGGYVPELKPSFTNCTFVGNHAGTSGGAIYNDGFVYSSNEVLQSTVVNSILWNNTATGSGPEVSNSGTNTVSYSIVRGSGGSGGGWLASIGTDGGNNTDVSPTFVSEADPDGADNTPGTADDGLRLGASSPAANTGNNAAPGLAGITTDFILASRIIGTTVDRGAYERSGIVIPKFPLHWLKDWRPYNPPCLVCPWSFLLANDIYQQFIWDGPAQLIDKGDYSIITGKIVLPKSRRTGFQVYIKLVNKHNWQEWSAKGRTYVAISLESILVSLRAHKTWTFWELSSESYLEGFGDLSGKLALSKFPTNNKTGFQFGKGANAWDKDLGVGGSFSYKGTLLVKGKKTAFQGNGAMNVDAEECKIDCRPLIEDSPIQLRGAPQEMITENAEPGFDVYPVPARNKITITAKSLPAGNYAVKIYNSVGQVQKQESINSLGANRELNVSGLKPGVYVVQLSSVEGTVYSKRIILQ